MPDRTFDILIDIQARVAAIDDATRRIQALNGVSQDVAGNIDRVGDSLSSTSGRISPILTGLIAGFGVGLAQAFSSFAQAALHAGESLRELAEDQRKVTLEFAKQTDNFITLAKTANSAGDVTNVGAKLVETFDQASKRLDELNQKQRTFFQFLSDSVLAGPTLSGRGHYEAALDEARSKATDDLRRQLNNFHALTAVAQETAAAFNRIKAESPERAIAEVTARIAELQAKADALHQKSLLPTNTAKEMRDAGQAASDFTAKSKEINLWEVVLQQLQKTIFNTAKAFAELTARAQDAINAASLANQQKALELAGNYDALAQSKAREAADRKRAEVRGIQDPILLAQNEKEAQAAAENVTQEYQQQKSLLAEHARLQDAKTAAQKELVAGNTTYGQQLLTENEIQTKALSISQERRISYSEAYAIAREQVGTEQGLAKLKEDQKSATEGERDARREITDLLREDRALLGSLQAQQRLIAENPFLGADEKQAALHANAIQQQEALTVAIGKTEGALQKAYGEGSQADIIRLGDALGDLKTRAVELGYTIQTTTFTGQLRAELTQWASSFGTAAHAVANILTTTLGTAIASTSQAITGLIFRTTSWKQAFGQAAQSIVGNIIQIVLQYTIGRAIMFIINKAFGEQEAQSNNQRAAQAAAQWAPGAIAASIASYGAAAGAGLAAFLGAEIIGTAAAVGLTSVGGGFLRGGYTGDGSPTDVAGVVHGGEYVLSADAVKTLGGPKALDDLHARAIAGLSNLRFSSHVPQYATGGYVGSGFKSSRSLGGAAGGEIAVYTFFDLKKMQEHFLNNDSTRKFVVDAVNQAGGNLRS